MSSLLSLQTEEYIIPQQNLCVKRKNSSDSNISGDSTCSTRIEGSQSPSNDQENDFNFSNEIQNIKNFESEEQFSEAMETEGEQCQINNSSMGENKNKMKFRTIEHENYAIRILQNKVDQNQVLCQQNIDFLKKHEINENQRGKMIDWMIEVMNSFQQSEETFFLAVNIMDRFFSNSQKIQRVQDLHLIGVTCMFMASKYEEIYPLRLEQVVEKISHGKLSKQQIKLKEIEIYEALDYSVTGSTIIDLIHLALLQLDICQTLIKDGKFGILKEICVYMAKMACYDYELQSQYSQEQIVGGCIYVSFKVYQTVFGQMNLQNMVQQSQQLLKINNNCLLKSSTKLLYMARNFQQLYPGLDNLKRYYNIFHELDQYQQQYQQYMQYQQYQQWQQQPQKQQY